MTLIELIAHTVAILKNVCGDEFDRLSMEAKQAAVMFALDEVIHANHYAKHVIAEIIQKEFA